MKGTQHKYVYKQAGTKEDDNFNISSNYTITTWLGIYWKIIAKDQLYGHWINK